MFVHRILWPDDRESLDATDFAKVKASSLLDFPAKYTEVKLASVSGANLLEHHLKATASLSYINQLVANCFEKYDLLEIFQEFPIIDTTVGWNSSTLTVDLFSSTDSTDNITFDQVKSSLSWMRKNIDVESSKKVNEYDRDLDWSREILLKACDIELCESIVCEEKELSNVDFFGIWVETTSTWLVLLWSAYSNPNSFDTFTNLMDPSAYW